jgi:D-alanyl-lipoteichoic acid acyltransferase DltB (MBOAT superfamily)
MLFNSYAFLLVFLPAAILIYSVADRDPESRCPVLIALSLAFYAYWDVRFLPLMIVSILANWYLAKAYAATRHGGLIVTGIAGNLLVLGFFKYTNFLADNFAALGIPVGHIDIALPLGISFFTFHHVMYLVDLRGGRAPLYPLDRYALYVCYFPQAISGPLARWSEVMDQFGQQMYRPGWEKRCALGVTLIVLGLLQKVLLADPLATAVDPIFAEALKGPVTDGKSWIALGFAFQLFFDFSGYSDIAIGVALIFGVQLPQNFDAPFRSTSIRDFWRRWHMTLSRFLRDYLYIPFGGNRFGLSRQIAALLATMAIGGLWHGAGWNFIIWGTLQGLAIACAVLWSRALPGPPAIVGWAMTTAFSMLSFVIFRAGSLEQVWHIYEGLLTLPQTRLEGRNALIAAAACAILLPSSHEICRRLTAMPRLTVPVGFGVAMVLVLVALGERQSYQFIYFQF